MSTDTAEQAHFPLDTKIVEIANRINRAIQSHGAFNYVTTRVVGADRTPHITPQNEIYVMNRARMAELGLPADRLEEIITAFLAHENAHAIAFPFMTKYRVEMATGLEFATKVGIPFDAQLFSAVSNLVSDVFNEVLLFKNGFHTRELSLLYGSVKRVLERSYSDLIASGERDGKLMPLLLLHLHVTRVAGASRPGDLAVKDPKRLHEFVYNLIVDTADGDLTDIAATNVAALEEKVAVAVEKGLFDVATEVADAFRKLDAGEIVASDFESVYFKIAGDPKPHWSYFVLLLATYKYVVDTNTAPTVIQVLQDIGDAIVYGASGDESEGGGTGGGEDNEGEEEGEDKEGGEKEGEKKEGEGKEGESKGGCPRVKGISKSDARILKGVMKEVMRRYGRIRGNGPGSGGSDLINPDLADAVAAKLSVPTLAVPESSAEYIRVRSPWLQTGGFPVNIDEATTKARELAQGDKDLENTLTLLLLEAEEEIPVSRGPHHHVLKAPPSRITVIIDESGSTGVETTILVPLIGLSTKVFDVERVTAMALLRNVLAHGADPPTRLYRFSDRVKVEDGEASKIYDRLKNLKGSDLEMGGTEIIKAVEKAIADHEDGPTNYFILATDMYIYDEEARTLASMIRNYLQESPVLILSIDNRLPVHLERLNELPNVAAVSVSSHEDYGKLESAIEKLVNVALTWR